MKIIKGTDSIPIEHPVLCIYGQPGIGKSSLGYSAKDPLLLDFDGGAHRAVNRKDTLQIQTWADVVELMESKGALEPYATIVIDTVGRLLDLMTLDIIENNPKMGRDGSLSLQGFGVLKGRFRGLLTQIRAMGKDVDLLAHHREDKDGDTTIMRPDIQGASYGEVMKSSDMIGFLYMRGKDRVLDFNPTDRWHGKNPAGWKPITIPAAHQATTLLAKLTEEGRAALGAISDESAKIAAQIDDWRSAIDSYTTAEECTKAVEHINQMQPEIAKLQVKKLLADKARQIGLVYSVPHKRFEPAPQPVAATA